MRPTQPDPTRSARFDPTQLDRHIEWLRRLARGLVYDTSLADDLVQETALAAIKTPPVLSDGSPRPWLARVLRNRAAHAARTASGLEAAKSVRKDELRTQGPQGESQAHGAIHELRTGQTLAELVLKLREPTRSTLLLRYWDDLPPRKIAKRQGIPLSTVKSRLARGLDQLRSELDSRNNGDRSAWLLAVLPMARAKSGAALLTLGGIGMQAKAITMLGAATLLGGTFYLLTPTKEAAPVLQDSVLAVETSEPQRQVASEPVGRGALNGERTALDADLPSASTASPSLDAAPSFSHTVEGIVLGADGRRIARVPIQSSSGETVATSDANGRFSLDVATARGQVECAKGAANWVTVRPGTFNKEESAEALVIVAASVGFAGVVVDEWGAVESGIDLILDLPSDFDSRFDESQAKSIRRDWRASTDAEGRFLLEDVPAIAGATLEATRGAGESVRIDLPMESRQDLRLEFSSAPIPDAARLDGRVLYPDGTGAGGAYVAMGYETIIADEDGRFALDLRATGSATQIKAAAVGFQPAQLKSDGDGGNERNSWPVSPEIRLKAPSLSIEGTLVDSEGKPQPGARVWIHDATDFGVLGTFPLIAEGIAGGFADPAGAGRSRGRLAAAEEPVNENSATGAFEPTSMLPFVVTDERGEFKFDGLLDRSYVLNVMGPNLSFGMQSKPIAAGQRRQRLELPEGRVFPEVRGQIVTRYGRPLPGVNLTPWIAALSKDQNVRGGTSSITRFFYATAAKTDAEGRFTLKSVPKRYVEFWIAGDGVTPLSKSVDDIDDPLNFMIEMAARIEVSVEIMDPTSGIDRVTAQGFHDEPMDLVRIYADGSSNDSSIAVENGRTGVFALTTDAATLTLMRGQEAVEVIQLDGYTDQVQKVVY